MIDKTDKEKLEFAIKTLELCKQHCLCTRNTYGFDYREKHDKLGKPKVGARWLTPKDIIVDAFNYLKASP